MCSPYGHFDFSCLHVFNFGLLLLKPFISVFLTLVYSPFLQITLPVSRIPPFSDRLPGLWLCAWNWYQLYAWDWFISLKLISNAWNRSRTLCLKLVSMFETDLFSMLEIDFYAWNWYLCLKLISLFEIDLYAWNWYRCLKLIFIYAWNRSLCLCSLCWPSHHLPCSELYS